MLGVVTNKLQGMMEGVIGVEPVATSKKLGFPNSHIKGNSECTESLLDQYALCILGRTLGLLAFIT